jgi:hypothetical protein
MSGPNGHKRKKPRVQLHKPYAPVRAGTTSRLVPHLSNIDRATSSNRSVLVGSVGENDHKRYDATVPTSIPATPAGNTVSDLTDRPSSEQFNAFRVNERSSLESYKQSMGFKLKADIFRILKFITNDSQLEFSMDPNSLCQYVCIHMHITGVQQGTFWTAVKDTVKRMIEKQRTNATSGCKRAFQGKFDSPIYW